jgi:hypothetical protein
MIKSDISFIVIEGGCIGFILWLNSMFYIDLISLLGLLSLSGLGGLILWANLFFGGKR